MAKKKRMTAMGLYCLLPPQAPSRFYGRVTIDALRVNKEIATIVEEVIERLTSQVGCGVEVTLEISAKRPAIREVINLRTLNSAT